MRPDGSLKEFIRHQPQGPGVGLTPEDPEIILHEPEPRDGFDNSAGVSALLFEQSVPGQAFYAVLDHGEILRHRRPSPS